MVKKKDGKSQGSALTTAEVKCTNSEGCLPFCRKIEACLDALNGARYFSTFDLRARQREAFDLARKHIGRAAERSKQYYDLKGPDQRTSTYEIRYGYTIPEGIWVGAPNGRGCIRVHSLLLGNSEP